ncbi:unnamed protein product [Strongylus vulgaris]|uniref:Uncharacterized protein n=1 Tax=Strongylus vulgaris TaxID=40348 RepID=A0A3P7IYC6_STRVU|nr:unnamed protein product [Strongylus vulgaris]
MESAECLMELDRKPAVKRCHDETLVEIETANTETGIAMAAKLDRMCGLVVINVFLHDITAIIVILLNPSNFRALNFFAGCVKTPIKQDCGSSAWQVIYRVLKDTTNTLMPGCQFTGASSRLVSAEVEEAQTKPTTLVTTTPRITTEPPTTTPLVLVEEFSYPPTAAMASSSSRKGMRKNIVSEELASSNASSRMTICFLLFIVMFC